MKKIWIAVGIVVLIGGLVGINIWQQQSKSDVMVETTTLVEETISETVMTPGKLKLDKEQNIYYQADQGDIAEVLVKEGDIIEKGTELVRYENEQLVLEEKENALQLRSAYLDINNLREQHKKIDKEIEKDKENEMLQEEHDQIKLQQQQANIEIERAQLQQESIEKQIADLVVKSEIEGTVVSVNEHISAGMEQAQEKPLIRIGSLDNLIVEGTISEYDTLKIKKDQPVTLTADAVNDKKWQGKVSLIADLPDETDEFDMDDSGVQYSIIVTVEDEMNLKPGFQILMEIETNNQKTTTLPINSVVQADDLNYVYIVEDGKAERREVEIGMVTNEKIEITDGLTNKDQVISNPPDDVKDGMEVKVK